MKKYLQKINYFWLLFYVFLFVFLLYHSFSYMDNDLGWHLRAGQDIYQTGEVPHLNYSNYTLDGERWVDHEWLANLISYFIFDKLGYAALNVFFVALFLLTLALLNNFILKYYLADKKNIFYLTFFEIFGLFGIIPHLGVRIQEFTVLFFVLLIILIYKYNKTKNYYLLLWLPVLLYLWVNLHAGFLLGIVLLFFWVGVKSVEIVIQKWKIFAWLNFDNVLTPKEVFIFFVMACLAIVPTFFTPYGLELYSFLGDYANTFYTKIIEEWLPIYYYSFQYWKLAYILIFIALFFLAIILSVHDNILKRYIKKNLDLWQLACLVVFLLMAFNVRRHFPLFFVVSLPILVGFFSEYLPIKMNWLFEFSKNKLIVSYLFLSLFFSMTLLVLRTNFTNLPFENKKFCQSFPCDSVNFIKNNPELRNKKIFNNYGWGGFMIWVWPEKQLFIDGRLPQYGYNEHTILEEYGDFRDKDKLTEKLRVHEIELVHLRKQEDLQLSWFEQYLYKTDQNVLKGEDALEKFLKTASDWQKFYEDDISAIYIK